jgi:hypothetical protein
VARARIFIDFWNFQLNWNQRANQAKCDWVALPPRLLQEVEAIFASVGQSEALTLEETLVHASVNPATEGNLRRWLDSFLDRQASYNVKVRERRMRSRKVHCKQCGTDNKECANCGAPFQWAPEKGVDAAIVTDLLSLATKQAFDVAILVTADADLIPAVEWVQDRGLKVVNASWSGQGFDLANACWGSFSLDSIISGITRT